MKAIKAKVHMLPTDKSYILSINGKIFSTGGVGREMGKKHGLKETIPQHLYITTDEEIKEDDWFINTGSSGHPTAKVYQANSENSKAFKEFGPYPEIRKIIATTDSKLITDGVAKSPQSFIEEYCKAGGIDEVLVEYEEKFIQNSLKGYKRMMDEVIEVIPKLNPNNSIIIHPVEEKMYSREEMLSFAKYVAKVGFGLNHTENLFDKWIEENL